MTDSREQAFSSFVGSYRPNTVLDGRVVQVVPFGAFVEVAEGVVGLLFDEQPAEGSAVRVRIVQTDLDRLRMSLALA
ncbi:S1 RNA-binding domain-containing protein [Actinocrispum wychmicini]|uniref:Small subunit ribosomal protein S1 n=1 Tax=Actinocrispum wychmicini TaxID=1213861 RepID=A0A4R2J3Z2_9PSEU|nr:S1 RNA-binding domain-containing protein [Actinocrispum wychmicini]TCO52397.1 small subunit ribosomal protein S1 [Actinocrispum wychmicini]